jgi:tetratricopeptide (TPR) repeat protein
VAKLLTETDVYIKYGLHEKALDHLRKVLAAAPESPDALEKVREIHAAAGHPGEAAEAGVKAVRALLGGGRYDRAREALARLRQLAPSHGALPELAAAVGVTEEVSLGAAEVEEVSEVDEGILAPAPARADEDALALAAAGHGDEEIVDDDEPVGAASGGEEHEDIALEVEEPPRRPAAPPPRAGAGRPLRRPGGEREPDLSDEIEEADFFLQQGLEDEARDALQNLLTLYPGHAVVRARLAEIDRRAARPAPAKADPGRPAAPGGPRPSPSLVSPAAHDESFDIARELADELDEAPAGPASADDDFQYSVEDVFNQFKRGVEQTVRKEDSATHYDLGIAYREMGLLDDAIQEFETALAGNDRKKEVDALSMIGLCRMAKGETRPAIAAYRRALRSDHLTRDAAKAIHYELGVAYEADGDRQVALWYLQKAAKADPGFRDVGKRVAALGGGPGRPPADAEGGASPRPAARAATSPPRPAAPPPAPKPAGAGPKKNIGYL